MSYESVINDFINETDIEFTNISNKMILEYHFTNGSHITIRKPIFLAILPNGVNLIYDYSQNCYKIRPKVGWWKKWQVKEGTPHFTKVDVFSIEDTQVELITS